MTNSLLVSAVNVTVAAVAFACFAIPRFTRWGLLLLLFLLLLIIVDIILVVRDLWTPDTRGRALFAVLLWIPVLFLLLMIPVWEGPLYVTVKGTPPTFQARGLAMFCGLEVYGPEHNQAEWNEDDIGLIWSFTHAPGHFPIASEFRYGVVPSEFVQTTPVNNSFPPSLDPTVTYALVVNRCMGGPQYLSLQASTLAESKPDACWGELKVPERKNSAYVRVDCKTHQPLPMSERAMRRLKAYRENRIPFY